MADNLDPETLRQLNDSLYNLDNTIKAMVPAMAALSGNGAALDKFKKATEEATKAEEAAAKAAKK